MKHPRVALIEASAPSVHVYSRTYLPRVGIPTMGAVLKKLGYGCDLWFQAMSELDEERLRQYDVVGIGSLTSTIREAYRLAESCKRPDNTVVMGGPHVTFMAEEALAHCDFAVIGEGDASFPALVAALANGESPASIPGLAYRLPSGDVHRTGPADAVDYASLPSPDFSLSPQVEPGRTPPIVATSRGCPNDCTFCSVTTMFGRRYRFKKNEQVIDELRPILHRSVCFGDDNFCASPRRAKSLLRDMIAQDAVPLRWSGQMCIEAATDDELLGLMQETRCRIVYVGIESVNDETLRKYGKPHGVEAIARCVENLHRHRIGIHGMFVVDADDSLEAVRDIVDYAIATDIDTIQICALTPVPGTRSHEAYRDRLLHRDWEHYDGLHVVVKPSRCSAYDMQMAIVREMQRFYSLRRILGAYRRGRGWRLKYRAGGYYLVRRWAKLNARYIERLER
ncbi:B12-binding domain-containing radical SAM protein [Planctomycetota bacterium]